MNNWQIGVTHHNIFENYTLSESGVTSTIYVEPSTPSSTPSPTPPPTPSSTPSSTPSPTPSSTPSPTPSSTPSSTPSPAPAPSPAPSPTTWYCTSCNESNNTQSSDVYAQNCTPSDTWKCKLSSDILRGELIQFSYADEKTCNIDCKKRRGRPSPDPYNNGQTPSSTPSPSSLTPSSGQTEGGCCHSPEGDHNCNNPCDYVMGVFDEGNCLGLEYGDKSNDGIKATRLGVWCDNIKIMHETPGV